MEWIETDVSALTGTTYIELLPGPYRGKCWQEGSLFLSEERFGYIEPLVAQNLPGYSHYAFNEGDRTAWNGVLRDLESLRVFLESGPHRDELQIRVGFFFGDSERRFAADLDANLARLIAMVAELDAWVRGALRRESVISVLGL